MAKPLSINISDSTLDQIAQTIADRSVEELKKVEDDGSLLLKKIALDFISALKQNITVIQNIEKQGTSIVQARRIMDAAVSSGNTVSTGTVAAYAQAKDKTQQGLYKADVLDNFFHAMETFNTEILKVIESHDVAMSFTFIDQKTKQPVILEAKMTDMFAPDSPFKLDPRIKSNRVTGAIHFTENGMQGLSQFISNTKEAIQRRENLKIKLRQYSVIGSKSLKGLNQSYVETDAQYKRNKEKHIPYVFWRIADGKDRWHKMRLVAAGDIAEAYAYFFYGGNQDMDSNMNNLFLGVLYDQNMAYFITKGIAQVDAVSGLYTSDVVTSDMDYSIKSLNATLPGYMQMKKLAQDILNNKVKNASELKQLALSQQYKDPIKREGQKGLRNFVEDTVAKEVPKQVKVEFKIGK